MYIFVNWKEVLNKTNPQIIPIFILNVSQKDISKYQINHMGFFWEYILTNYLCKYLGTSFVQISFYFGILLYLKRKAFKRARH